MYKLAFNILLIVSFLGTSTLRAIDLSSFKREYSKEIKKDFKFFGTELVSLNNQFGKISVETWSKDRVKLAIEIKVKAENESQAQKIFKRISIQFNNASDLIEAITVVHKEEKSWWQWSSENTNFEINYTVFMPARASLIVKNKYGDVYLGELTGVVDLDLKYGNYQCDGFTDDCTFSFKYSEGRINYAKQISGDIKYGSLTLIDADELIIESKYSNIDITTIGNIKAETGYDNYIINKVGECILNGKYNNVSINNADVLFVNSKYSKFDIGSVLSYLSFDVSYSEVNINHTDPSFSDIRLQGRYSDFDLTLGRNTSFQLDAKSEYAGITYPRDLTISHEREQSSVQEVKGWVGNQSAPMIKARLKYGSLKLRK